VRDGAHEVALFFWVLDCTREEVKKAAGSAKEGRKKKETHHLQLNLLDLVNDRRHLCLLLLL
jgi:hypothetical protein